MRNTHSFAVNFIKRINKAGKNSVSLYARISLDGERAEISLKEKIPARDWDSNKEIVRGKSIETKTLNRHIDDVRFQIKEKYRNLLTEGTLLTAELVKQAYLAPVTTQKGHTLLDLTTYYRKIWKDSLQHGNFKNYKTTIDYIELFIKNRYSGMDIFLSQLTMEFVTEFEYYIRNFPIKKHDPCLGNGVAKHIQRFKRILNWAVQLKWLIMNPIETYSCPLKKNKRKKLTLQQIVALEQKNIRDPVLKYAKDLFLFSCHTGLAFADVMQLQRSHFECDVDGTVWCKIYRQKTGVLSPVPLLKYAAGIIKAYANNPDVPEGSVFPFITNQQVNRRLKIIREICEIDIPMSFHIARHTFAKTVAIKHGIPLETVQVLMGHTKITTTMI